MIDLTGLPTGASLTGCLLRGSTATCHVPRMSITLAPRGLLYPHISTHLARLRPVHPSPLLDKTNQAWPMALTAVGIPTSMPVLHPI